MKVSALVALGVSLSACSSSSSSSGVPDAGATLTDDSGPGGSSPGQDAGTSVDAAPGDDAQPPVAEGGTLTGHQARIVLEIPADYKGTLSKLDLVYNKTPQFIGPPTGTLYEGTPSGLAAGQPLTVIGDATGASGSYYVVAVLYMKGGGTFVPMPGVDYVGETSSPVVFTGAPIDLGSLAITVAPDDGGL